MKKANKYWWCSYYSAGTDFVPTNFQCLSIWCNTLLLSRIPEEEKSNHDCHCLFIYCNDFWGVLSLCTPFVLFYICINIYILFTLLCFDIRVSVVFIEGWKRNSPLIMSFWQTVKLKSILYCILRKLVHWYSKFSSQVCCRWLRCTL